jgi:Spy/CpxP family protein refolding chaperone
MKYYLYISGFMRSKKALPAIAVILALACSFSYAQPNGRKGKQDQIEKAKIAFINERLTLTDAQSAKFWPVYNEFSKKRREEMMSMRKLNKENKDSSTSEDQIRQNLSLMLDKRQAIVNLEKEYLPRFLAIINPRQVDALQKAERDFLKMLRKRMEGRR